MEIWKTYVQIFFLINTSRILWLLVFAICYIRNKWSTLHLADHVNIQNHKYSWYGVESVYTLHTIYLIELRAVPRLTLTCWMSRGLQDVTLFYATSRVDGHLQLSSKWCMQVSSSLKKRVLFSSSFFCREKAFLLNFRMNTDRFHRLAISGGKSRSQTADLPSTLPYRASSWLTPFASLLIFLISISYPFP